MWRIGFHRQLLPLGENCQRVMSNARAAPSTLPSEAELIQLNMTAPFLTHGGLAAARRGTLLCQEAACFPEY